VYGGCENEADSAGPSTHTHTQRERNIVWVGKDTLGESLALDLDLDLIFIPSLIVTFSRAMTGPQTLSRLQFMYGFMYGELSVQSESHTRPPTPHVRQETILNF
jgi:hypothetical protein